MLIYILAILTVTFLPYGKKTNNASRSRTAVLILVIILILIGGLRDASVGSDSWAYVENYRYSQTFIDAMTMSSVTYEYGFGLLNWTLHVISDNYVALFLGISSIVVACYIKTIVSVSDNIRISVFLFLATGLYTFSFNGARQSIAAAICALALQTLIQGKLKQYIIYVILAATFHKTAVIMLPAYFLLRRKNNWRANIIFLIVGLVGIYILPAVINMGGEIDGRYKSFGEYAGGGGTFTIILNCIVVIFFFMCKGLVRDRYRYDIFLNMLILSAAISLVSAVSNTDPSGILRLTLYFNVAVLFLWPMLIQSIPSRNTQGIIIHFMGAFYLIFYVLSTERFSNLVPYKFNPILY